MNEPYLKTVTGYAEKIKDSKREKLSVPNQIEHMKNQGIKFTIEDEAQAEQYLSDNTYYFKLKAYAKLYEKYNGTDLAGQYVNLEFAYLRDLATIDCYLRKEIISISLDIEHYLKVLLLRDFNNSNEDGYKIINDFIKTNETYYLNQIETKSKGKPCSNLVNKYHGNFAIWNFVEILSFGDFKELFQFFYSRNDGFTASEKLSYYINPVRMLRNAAAHNNCLLHTLANPYVDVDKFNYNRNVNSFLGKNGIKNRNLTKSMAKPLLHDFCVMLYLYHKVAPIGAQKYTYERLKELFNNRIVLHRDYYQNNPTICSAYNFMDSVIDVFISLSEK